MVFPFISDRTPGWIAALLTWMMIAGCEGHPKPSAEPLVRAWGETLIEKREFRARLLNEAPECSVEQEDSCLEIKRLLLNRMIEDALLHRAVDRANQEIPTAELDDAEKSLLGDYKGAEDVLRAEGFERTRWRKALEERIRINRFLQEILVGVVVTHEEIVAYFRSHRELFVRPREVRLRQIVVARGDEAMEILKKLKKGADFARLAREHSLSPEAAEGGDLGFLRPGQLPSELDLAAFSLQVGKVSDVIPTPYGFHILRVEERREPRVLALSEVEQEIRRWLLQQKRQKAFETWMSRQWEEARVEILDPSLVSGSKKRERIS